MQKISICKLIEWDHDEKDRWLLPYENGIYIKPSGDEVFNQQLSYEYRDVQIYIQKVQVHVHDKCYFTNTSFHYHI